MMLVAKKVAADLGLQEGYRLGTHYDSYLFSLQYQKSKSKINKFYSDQQWKGWMPVRYLIYLRHVPIYIIKSENNCSLNFSVSLAHPCAWWQADGLASWLKRSNALFSVLQVHCWYSTYLINCPFVCLFKRLNMIIQQKIHQKKIKCIYIQCK